MDACVDVSVWSGPDTVGSHLDCDALLVLKNLFMQTGDRERWKSNGELCLGCWRALDGHILRQLWFCPTREKLFSQRSSMETIKHTNKTQEAQKMRYATTQKIQTWNTWMRLWRLISLYIYIDRPQQLNHGEMKLTVFQRNILLGNPGSWQTCGCQWHEPSSQPD